MWPPCFGDPLAADRTDRRGQVISQKTPVRESDHGPRSKPCRPSSPRAASCWKTWKAPCWHVEQTEEQDELVNCHLPRRPHHQGLQQACSAWTRWWPSPTWWKACWTACAAARWPLTDELVALLLCRDHMGALIDGVAAGQTEADEASAAAGGIPLLERLRGSCSPRTPDAPAAAAAEAAAPAAPAPSAHAPAADADHRRLAPVLRFGPTCCATAWTR
jgi:hypothetical protein